MTLIADTTPPTAVAESSETFVDPMDPVVFDGSKSEDMVGIHTYMWDFGDENVTNVMDATNKEGIKNIEYVTHQYAKAGKYTATPYRV